MYRYSCFKILLISFLFPVYGDIEFNSLNQHLVLNLINVSGVKNVVASEQLVRFPLCKLASVATGEAKQQLMLFLGYKDDVALTTCYRKIKGYISILRQSDLTVTNRIYLNFTKGIDQKFITNSSENYGVQVEKIGFNFPRAAIAHINNLISAMTFKRITDIVDSNDINKSTKMIIITGAHFKGTWEKPFDYRLTKLMKFNHIDGKTSKIPMMHKIGDFWYNRAGNCEVLIIRLRGFESSMTIVLPKTAREFLSVLHTIYNDKEFLTRLIKGSQEKMMKITIPRLKIKTFIDWTGFLQGLGLYSIFNTSSSDLAGIFKAGQNQTISLSKIKQKVFIQMDEMGVFRGTADRMKEKEPPEMLSYNLLSFIADRPFYFEIAWDLDDGRHKLFSGVYYGPEPELAAF